MVSVEQNTPTTTIKMIKPITVYRYHDDFEMGNPDCPPPPRVVTKYPMSAKIHKKPKPDASESSLICGVLAPAGILGIGASFAAGDSGFVSRDVPQ